METQSSTNIFEPMGNPPTGSPASLPKVSVDPFGNTWVDLSELPPATLEQFCNTCGVSQERLSGRMAAQEAVAMWLRNTKQWSGLTSDVRVSQNAKGRPILPDPLCEGLFLSLSHCGLVGVARLSKHPFVGIDVESIKPRGEAFERRAFTEGEIRLLPSENRAEWVTRFWAAKESVGKAQGTGLNFSPGNFPIRERVGDLVRVGESWVQSHAMGNFAMAWTMKSPPEKKIGSF